MSRARREIRRTRSLASKADRTSAMASSNVTIGCPNTTSWYAALSGSRLTSLTRTQESRYIPLRTSAIAVGPDNLVGERSFGLHAHSPEVFPCSAKDFSGSVLSGRQQQDHSGRIQT